jgi:hypothetical protein
MRVSIPGSRFTADIEGLLKSNTAEAPRCWAV